MITNIELHNFKCFDDLDIDVSNLSIFMGINGAGKSSVIQSLLLQRQSFKDPRVDFSEEVLFNGDLVDLKTAHESLYLLSDNPEIEIKLFDHETEYSTIIKDASKEESIVNCEHPSGYKQMIENCPLFADSFVYLYADRAIPQEVYSQVASSKTNSRIGDRSGHLTAAYLLKSLKDSGFRNISNSALSLAGDDQSLISNTSLWMNNILGIKSTVGVDENSEKEVSLSYTVPAKEVGYLKVSPVNMPFGNSSLLPIVVAILSAPKGSMVVIENPEVHLHPSAQTRLGRFLATAAHCGIQVFVETHSDHLINGIRKSLIDKVITPEEVALHFIYQDSDDSMVHNDDQIFINEKGEMDKWPSHFMDEWERSLYDLSSVDNKE